MIPRKPGWWIVAIVLWLLGLSVAPAWSGPWPFPDRSPSQGDRRAPSARATRAQLDGLRVPFVANDGRFDAQVAYYVPGAGSAFFVTQQGELVYALRRQDSDRPGANADGRRTRSEMRRSKSRASARGWALTEVLVDGQARLVAQDRGVTGVSDFRGNDPARWRSGLATYQAVGLGEVWPGVTVALQARGNRIEKIFTVQPGGSVDRIRVHVKGARALSLSADGALVARTGVGDVAFTAPVAYQERAGVRQPVGVSYRLEGRRYGFTVGAYDPTLPLVIDPLLQSTFLGGDDDDFAYAIAIHPTTGDVYVTGETSSFDFPGTGGGAFEELATDFGFVTVDGFVARLNASLTVLRQATYFGGDGSDSSFAIAIDPGSGDVYVAGRTDSSDFPTTGSPLQSAPAGGDDAFVARFSSDLKTLVAATYFGGTGDDEANALALHATDDEVQVYIAGTTSSGDLLGTGGAAQPELDSGVGVDAFVARLTSDLGTLTRTTYLGGTDEDTGFALAIAPGGGDIYVAGETFSTDFPMVANGAQPSLSDGGCGCAVDVYVSRLTNDLTTIVQSTYLGGTDRDEANALAIHPMTGDVYVAGRTLSGDFPGTTAGAQPLPGGFDDAYVARLPGSLQGPIVATYLGGNDDDVAWGVAIHPVTGDVYVAGGTVSPNFPSTLGGVQESFGGCDSDMFIARLSKNLNAIFQATYLGGVGCDEAFALAISPLTGDIYVAGQTEGPFPGTEDGAQAVFGGFFSDGVVARLTRSLAAVEPDLAITKTHVGSFLRGQIGATYTITVTNVGTAPTDGTEVTVEDIVPADLTPTALGGSGWSCTLDTTRRCKRSDVLNPAASYPPITLTVDVPTTAPALVINTAVVSGGGDVTPDNNAASNPTTIVSAPDLTITKTHVGNFFQGQVGATYTITVSNVGALAADGSLVTVTDTVPAGLTPTALGGAGWDCTVATRTCTRSEALGPAAAYPAITLTVDVAGNAPSSVANTAAVAGGGDANPANNTASDVTTIVAKPDLTITKTHVGNFFQGQAGAAYTITVINVGTAATDGTTVTVTDTVPAGLTPTALEGDGWICAVATRTCTRSTVLGAGATYPAITLTVDVAGNASGPLINTATVAGGGDATSSNNSANDPATIGTKPDLAIAKTHAGTFTRGQVGATYTITVSNLGTASTAGTVTVTDTPPAGLTPTALSGPGWNCHVVTVTCTRGDALANGASYQDITLTVSVATDAPGSVANTATVSGGGDVNTDNNTSSDATTIGFIDVPPGDPFFPWVEALFAAGITGGCSISPPQYCPDADVTRAQMAVFLLRGIHGGGYQPPAATGAMFADVPLSHPFAAWIEQLAREGITGGCSAGPPLYCPDAGVSRAQMAVFLLRAKHGAAYQPPAATGLFTDVRLNHPLASWIEQLAREGISTGCGPSTYCPDTIVTREQMAILLVRAFNLPM